MKILVVDRDKNILDLYAEELKEWGHEVIVLNRGDRLLVTIIREKPQALVLGVRISGYDYFDLLQTVKATFPKLPVIFNTSLAELWQQAEDYGADFCVSKSSDLSDLKTAIESAGERKLTHSKRGVIL